MLNSILCKQKNGYIKNYAKALNLMIYPDFIDTERFFLMDVSKSEKEQIMALSANIKTLQTLKATNFSSFHELIEKYLNAGLRFFSMQIGIVSEINGDDYTVCNCVSEIDQIAKGTIFPLEGTYCREVVKMNTVIGLPHVGKLEEMKNHPVYQNMKLEAYISAPIFVEGELFGTLNFSSTVPRNYGFSEYEKDLITMMSSSIGSFLKFERKENALKKSTERMKQLVGYVAHDLRGPLSNISTLASFIQSKKYEDIVNMIQTSSDKALEFVHTILETAALGSGKIMLQLAEHNVSKLLQNRSEYYSSIKSGKDLEWILNIKPDLTSSIDKDRILQVIDNILSNCSKYTSHNGKVTITLKVVNNHYIRVHIFNTISSTQDTNKVFDVHNHVGFGQEIVREILKLHHSKLNIYTEDGLYNVQFDLKLAS